ncbi:cupin domain-containing protein [Paenarthrobacter nicotinovorans]|uniref:cupin domain-containing protein n=1 Tax=Paenarthrobacter nicotinovorans TaxID=29320 RepID=UPI003801A145
MNQQTAPEHTSGIQLVLAHSADVNGTLAPAGQRPGADSGDPQLGLLPLATNGNGSVGVWECEPGGWPVKDRADTEVCYILSGSAVITDEATGTPHKIGTGDFLVLPVGWSGRWDVLETVRKVYAIY